MYYSLMVLKADFASFLRDLALAIFSGSVFFLAIFMALSLSLANSMSSFVIHGGLEFVYFDFLIGQILSNIEE